MLKCKLCSSALTEFVQLYETFYRCKNCKISRPQYKGIFFSKYQIRFSKQTFTINAELFKTNKYSIVYTIKENNIINTIIGIDTPRPEISSEFYVDNKLVINGYQQFDFSNNKLDKLIIFQ